jgi:cysteine desulfurase
VAGLVGCDPDEVVFTSGATEAAAVLGSLPPDVGVASLEHEHDCIYVWNRVPEEGGQRAVFAYSLANGETGLRMPQVGQPDNRTGFHLLDVVQLVGRDRFDFARSVAAWAIVSGHKLGGPKGTGALIVRKGLPFEPWLRGGGQERGRRAGTENVIGIAGFGAAALAARHDIRSGVWEGVSRLRDRLEERLADAAPDLRIYARGNLRLPNTSCLAVPGWKGETQVMQMDLAGFAVSAGAACSSGKVGPSRVMRAAWNDSALAAGAIRVSMGPTTTEGEVDAFATAWIEHYERRMKNTA